MVAVFQRFLLIDFALSGLFHICRSYHWATPNAIEITLSGLVSNLDKDFFIESLAAQLKRSSFCKEERRAKK